MLCLEIGPGKKPCKRNPDEVWETVDAHVDATYNLEWGRKPFPVAANRYDYVFSSHVIEHVPWYLTAPALKEVHRVMKPGALIDIFTLDFAAVVDAYLAKKVPDGYKCFGKNPKLELMKWCASRIVSHGEENPFQWHKALFDKPYLARCLKEAGLTVLQEDAVDRGPPHAPHIHIGLRAQKPG